MALIELVDYDGVFVDDFKDKFAELGLLKSGLRYNVVTVLGCQSSGKSTLLNHMFSTSFPEMNSLIGRQQTTKGIWCGRDPGSPTLVIDVEGTDSKERGENRLTFEHRASLLSLAIADVVIINMWYHDIGRYTASNYGLLQTVFEVMLELFAPQKSSEDLMKDSEKTLLLFVIRDHSEQLTPLNKLERVLLTDIQKIWAEIKKPLPLQSTTADDFFKFKVVSLPSIITEETKFDAEAAKLRTQWIEKLAPREYTRHVPADGFPFYAESIWNTIMNSQQLDIPSQKEMVATYRCGEMKRQAFEEFKQNLEITLKKCTPIDLFTPGGSGTRKNESGTESSKTSASPANTDPFNASSEQKDNVDRSDASRALLLIQQSITTYHTEASRYDQSVYLKKREELIDQMYAEFQILYDQYLNSTRLALTKKASTTFKTSLKNVSDESVQAMWSQFAKISHNWFQRSVEDFQEKCTSTSLHGSIALKDEKEEVKIDHDFTSTLQQNLLEEALVTIWHKTQQDEEIAFLKYLEDSVTEIRKEIELMNLEPSLKNYWGRAAKIVKEKAEALFQEHKTVISTLYAPLVKDEHQISIVTDDEDANHDAFVMSLWRALYTQYSTRVDRIAEGVYKRFRKIFDTDENGIPNYWASSSPDKIKHAYIEAKKKAVELHPILCKFQIPPEELLRNDAVVAEEDRATNEPEVLLAGVKEADSLTAAEKFMLKACQEAQFIQATGGRVTSTAWWMWLLVLVLGWNEIMYVIRSPIFFLAFFTALTLFAGMWYTRHLFAWTTHGRYAMSFILGNTLPLLNHLQNFTANSAPAAGPPPPPGPATELGS